jgi:ribosome-associated translation inhibitor RaiA
VDIPYQGISKLIYKQIDKVSEKLDRRLQKKKYLEKNIGNERDCSVSFGKLYP